MITEKEIIEDFNSINLYLTEALNSLKQTLNDDNTYFNQIEFAIDHLDAINYFINKYSEVQNGRA